MLRQRILAKYERTEVTPLNSIVIVRSFGDAVRLAAIGITCVHGLALTAIPARPSMELMARTAASLIGGPTLTVVGVTTAKFKRRRLEDGAHRSLAFVGITRALDAK